MTTSHRLAALAVGVTLALGVTAGCAAAPATVADYLTEMRGTIPADESAYMDDDQLIAIGQSMCSAPDIMQAAKDSNGGQGYAAVSEKYCDALNAAPQAMVSESDAGTEIDTGPQPVKIGERFDVYDGYGTKLADIAITNVAELTDCSEATKYISTVPTPQRGHFVTVTMDVATAPGFVSDKFGSIMAADFSKVGADGYAAEVGTTGTEYCVPQDEEFGLMNPSTKYRGTVLLDMADLEGQLVFQPRFNRDGWAGVKVDMP